VGPGIRNLRAFLAVADHGSVNKAAAALLRAQSAVTRSIHELERELEVDLFERRAQGMLPTRFGQALLLRARLMQAEMERARRELQPYAAPRGSSRNAPIFDMLVPERRLQIFVALAEQHHMPSVADSIGVTQPAVSMAIRHFEESIGVELFDRTARGMLPTPAGAILALRVKRVLAELRNAIAEIGAMRGISRGLVTVGALPLGRTRWLPTAIARLVESHPGLRVATVEGSFELLAAGLRAGDLDFILGALRPPDFATDLAGEELLDDELAVVVRARHPWVKRKRIALQDLVDAKWALPRDGAPTRSLLQQALVNHGLPPPDVVLETSDLAVLRGALLESDLLTAISPRQLHYEFEARLLTVLPVPLPETRRRIGITQRVDSHPSPGATLLMAEIRRLCPVLMQGRTATAGGAPRGR
jgi:LysR family transcriptional regulator of gallate degradation